jgi:toxin ParE1/3/4
MISWRLRHVSRWIISTQLSAFFDAAEAAFARLAALPSIGATVPFASTLAQGMRVWRVEGFERYLIFYRAVEHGIEVVRVLHAARDFPMVFS